MASNLLLNNQYDLFNLGIQSTFYNKIYNTSYNTFVELLLNDIDNNSTSSQNIEIENRKHIDYLRRNESYFIQLLLNVDYEDGNTNDAILFFEKQLNKNSIATSNWLAEIFMKYSISEAFNEKSKNILYGLLRIIAYLNNHDCFDYIKGTLTLILKTTLETNIPYLQEAGLMVIESWRSLDCLNLLKDFSFDDAYIIEYSKILIKELTTELTSKSEVQTCSFA